MTKKIQKTTEQPTNDPRTEIAIRNEAGKQIDPGTAEVTYWYVRTLDPYGVYPDLPAEYDQVGREYFARSPDSDIWVSYRDLPDATLRRLCERLQRQGPLPDDSEDILF